MIDIGEIVSTDAIIFDLDGTLVDSSCVVAEAMRSWCERNGLDLQRVMEAGEGRRTEDTVALVAPHLDARREAVGIEQLERAACDRAIAVKGAREFLDGIPVAKWGVVTSSGLLTAGPKITASGLPLPNILVTGEMVARGKPDPEGFLFAASRLGVASQDCIVFEDADAGVAAAIAGGWNYVLKYDLA